MNSLIERATYKFGSPSRMLEFATDFLTTASPQNPWSFGAIASGTNSAGTADSNHPGFSRLTSSNSQNSGGRWITDAAAFKITGGEETEFVFNPNVTTDTTTRMGFHDTNSHTDATDGVYIDIQGTTLKGRTGNNSGYTDTVTTYTVTDGTWYRAKIVINSSATLVTFTLYSEAGVVLWSDTVAATIPTTSGRQTGHGIVSTNSGTSAQVLTSIDFMSLSCSRVLTR